jgi:multidrug efflux pump subunit AcrA (membrane-fusion protein)
VSAVFVDENLLVKRGVILYRIVPAPYQAALDAAVAQLAARRAVASSGALLEPGWVLGRLRTQGQGWWACREAGRLGSREAGL